MKQNTFNIAENYIAGQINISKIPIDSNTQFDLDHNTDWVQELLIELNSTASDTSEEEKLSNTELKIQIDIEKKFSAEFGEYIIIKATVAGNYLTECVKTLKTMGEIVHLEFNSCLISNEHKDDEQYADQTEIFANQELRELYFYSKGLIDVKELVHEQIFLNINAYPTLETEEVPQ